MKNFNSGDNYRYGNKSLETRFNQVYTHSSRTEPASEITMTPALYSCTIINPRRMRNEGYS